jgi:hypothetical protein
MHSHSGIGSKWRRFNRKFGSGIFLGFIVLVIVAIVGFLFFALGSPNWRARW